MGRNGTGRDNRCMNVPKICAGRSWDTTKGDQRPRGIEGGGEKLCELSMMNVLMSYR